MSIQMLMRVIYFGLILLFVAFAASAGPMNDGLEAFRSGDEPLATYHWQPLGKRGNAKAQFYLSVIYGNGSGSLEDSDLSILWLKRSVKGGFAPAQFNLGNHYFQGRWVSQDLAKAKKLWQLSAKQGWEGAQYNLGNIYYRGIGIKRNWGQAQYWLELAAKSGSKPAIAILAKMERKEEGAPSQSPSSFDKFAAEFVMPGKDRAQNQSISVSVAKASDLDGGREWVMAQNPNNWTLQLLASEEMDRCLEASKEISQQLKASIFAYRYQIKRKLHCALLVGSFSTRDEAWSLRSQMPLDPARGKPWARKFKSLQKRVHN